MELSLCGGVRVPPYMDAFLVPAPRTVAIRYRVETYDSPPEIHDVFLSRVSSFDIYGTYPRYTLACKYLLDSREDACYLFLDLAEKTGRILVPAPEPGNGTVACGLRKNPHARLHCPLP